MNIPKVIKVYGRARIAYDEGQRYDRQDQIYVPSEKSWFYTTDTESHFVYRQENRRGPTLMCSCGSSAGIYGYEAYRQFTSTNRGRVICCTSFIETKKHGDGSYG